MLKIDGSYQEGGGQILRTALALSLVTHTPIRIEKIRAGRKRPGLMRQHLAAVNAAATVGHAAVVGNTLGSQELTFIPGEMTAGEYTFPIGSAGSTTLVLQTVLPALLSAKGWSRLTLEGGTHNTTAPPYDFLEKAFLPLLRRAGAQVSSTLKRAGFYPAGGGRMEVIIEPATSFIPIDLSSRGEIRRRSARAILSRLPRKIAERELAVIERELSWGRDLLTIEEWDSAGPGNVLLLEVESEQLTELFSSFGERGLPAEIVADRAVKEVRRYLAAGVAVGEHLADQLLLPMALMKGGCFSTLPPSRHTLTNIDIIRKFLTVPISVLETDRKTHRIEVEV
ncbi:MAG: RNA 3'-terminal phosphate cyclase [Candidatus Manganitrophaceae bacterium]|nr:MAG: RNA 3'-terminal phosphate cyclase [Candidatus Manganitrophaceae bacterium]